MQDLRARVEAGGAGVAPGVHAAGHAFLAACLKRLFPTRPILLVTEGLKTQEAFEQDLSTWLRDTDPPNGPGAKPLFFPAWDVLPHEARLPHADTISERLETLAAAAAPGFARAVVASVPALLQRTFPPGEFERRLRRLKRGDRIEPLDLVEWLEDQGYEPEAQVTQKGELALRGGILDVYPLPSPWPVRFEFFGDEIESLRYFDPQTQISREAIEEVALPPAGELAFLKKQADTPAEGPELALLLDHLPASTILILADPAALLRAAEQYEAQIPSGDRLSCSWVEFLRAAEERGLATVSLAETIDPAEFAGFEAGAPRALAELALAEPEPAAPFVESLDAFRPSLDRAADPEVAQAQRRAFFDQIHRWLRQERQVHVVCNNEGERQRFEEVWAEYGLDRTEPKLAPTFEIGALSRGFQCEAARVVVVTDAEVFGRYKVVRPRRLKSPHAAATRSALDIDFGDLSPGDFVVHLQHGIGRYQGLEASPAGLGQKQGGSRDLTEGAECLVIEYAPADSGQSPPRLYVPVTEAHLVSKYVGAGKAHPPLHTLGGTRWHKAKAQAEEAVRDLAAELLSMQAARESLPGHPFGEDTPWQREFEGAFIYEETPDQKRAIDQAKLDMAAPKPMDRLICGDVGYGKTEVAIRAAFKAVMGGKQVAFLVPTTILAQQHFNTLRERMADYPVRVEQLSRFRTKGEQRRVLADLAEGAVDIVVGTHRLVQDDVSFKDLGLVVIDEEQRFGVMHKEKLKLLRQLVDVLTLSATPIPRTLYLALAGARDMSTIETPPQDRLPVETVVSQYDERLIRDAIQRELNRGGQTYFLHNRVLDIYEVAARVRSLVPAARVVVGHGQMDSDELEEVMVKFIDGEADVLVSTTIIESGIDIPNANTIIIDRADRFGLSDLYQLRGRVGRYKHQAYAYLLLPRHASLLSDVRKRISAIKQYSSLGSGFKIAMRDLEIRGAGNLLGAQQSGHITAVGFDLYCQLLKQSVGSLKGEKVHRRADVQVRLDFLALNPGEESARLPATKTRPAGGVPFTEPGPETKGIRAPAYLPVSYIPDAQQRIGIYRKLAQAEDKAALDRIRTELRDRFGKLAPAAELLLQVTELKIIAGARGVSEIESEGDKLKLTRHNDLVMQGGKFPRLARKEASARLNEIKKLLLALPEVD